MNISPILFGKEIRTSWHVDVNIEPYNRLKMALYESRVLPYYRDAVDRELKGLEKNKKKGKVDRRVKGSKDVADGLAGVVCCCEARRIPDPVEPSLGELQDSDGMEEFKRQQEELSWLLEG